MPAWYDLAGEDVLAEDLLLPGVGRDDARCLARQIDAGRGTEAVLLRPVAQPVGPEHARELVEERVARVAEPVVDVDVPEAQVVPVGVDVGADAQVGPCLDLRLRGDLLVGKCPGAGHQLVRRSGRVLLGDGVVQERLVGVLEIGLELRLGDALGERVVVVGRQRDHGQDLTRLGVHGDEDAGLDMRGLEAPFQRRLGLLLRLEVDRQVKRVAGDGVLRLREHAKVLAKRVALVLLRAVLPTKRGLVLRLDARLADLVVRQVPLRAQPLEVGGRHRAGVTHDLGKERAVQVVALRLDDDAHPGQLEMLFRDDPGHVLGHARGDRHLVEAGAGILVDRLVDRARAEVEEGREAGDDRRALRQGQVRRQHLDRVGRDVADERGAVPVVDEAAGRGDLLRHDAVAVGKAGVVAALIDLEVEQPRREHAEDQRDDEAEHDETAQQ